MVLAGCLSSRPACGEAWQTFCHYRQGFPLPGVRTAVSSQTQSQLTPEGLRILDPSKESDSLRCYNLPWNADPRQGATVEARLKAVSCSDPWGMCLFVSDGTHEEGITFFPDRVLLAKSNLVSVADRISR